MIYLLLSHEFNKRIIIDFPLNENEKIFILNMGKQIFLKDIIHYVKSKKNSELKVIENCGHVVNIQSSEKFNEYAIGFIKSNTVS